MENVQTEKYEDYESIIQALCQKCIKEKELINKGCASLIMRKNEVKHIKNSKNRDMMKDIQQMLWDKGFNAYRKGYTIMIPSDQNSQFMDFIFYLGPEIRNCLIAVVASLILSRFAPFEIKMVGGIITILCSKLYLIMPLAFHFYMQDKAYCKYSQKK